MSGPRPGPNRFRNVPQQQTTPEAGELPGTILTNPLIPTTVIPPTWDSGRNEASRSNLRIQTRNTTGNVNPPVIHNEESHTLNILSRNMQQETPGFSYPILQRTRYQPPRDRRGITQSPPNIPGRRQRAAENQNPPSLLNNAAATGGSAAADQSWSNFISSQQHSTEDRDLERALAVLMQRYPGTIINAHAEAGRRTHINPNIQQRQQQINREKAAGDFVLQLACVQCHTIICKRSKKKLIGVNKNSYTTDCVPIGIESYKIVITHFYFCRNHDHQIIPLGKLRKLYHQGICVLKLRK